MIVPQGLPNFAEALRAGAEVFHTLKKLLHERKASTGVGDEGGFAPDLPGARGGAGRDHRGDREGRLQAGQGRRAGARRRVERVLRQGEQDLQARRRRQGAATASGLVDFYRKLCEQFPIVSIEDGLAENDWDGWKALTQALGKRVQLVGDDLFVTNTERIKDGIDEGRRQQRPGQGEPDRHADRDARRDRDGAPRRLDDDHLAPLGRDRGHVHRRPGGGDERRPDQDRLARAHRSRRQVQPAAAHRGRAGRRRHLGRLPRPALDDPGVPLPPRFRPARVGLGEGIAAVSGAVRIAG